MWETIIREGRKIYYYKHFLMEYITKYMKKLYEKFYLITKQIIYNEKI